MLQGMRMGGALALLAMPAAAGVITIDDDGGADFTDLPPAVAAAAPGDTLLVHLGDYSGFLLFGKPLAIVGLVSGQVHILGTSRVAGIAAGDELVLCDLDFGILKLNDSPGVIVIDRVRIFADTAQRFVVSKCADVRAIGLHVDWGTNLPLFQWGATASSFEGPGRVEIVDGWISGRWGTTDATGEHAARVHGGVALHLAGSTVWGGSGGVDSQPCFIGCFCSTYGADGLQVEGTQTSVRLSGLPGDVIGGGSSGDCLPKGCAVRIDADEPGSVWYSGVQFVFSQGSSCMFVPPSANQVVPAEPFLDRLGSGGAAGPLRFRVHGLPGDQVTLHLGRDALVQPIPGVLVEQLTTQEVAIPLGTIPPGKTWVESNLFHVPVGVPKGTTFFAQARVVRSGAEWRTNSAPIVLR